MHKTALFLILAVALPGAPASAEEADYLFDPIIVSATRSEIETIHAAENFLIYSDEAIAAMPAFDLTDVLTHAPGVDVQPGSRLGQATALSIHGSDARQVLVMVDGIPFNTQLSGQANPSKIPLDHIERVEVIKGAASSVWGSSMGGVVNVITRDVGDTVVPTGEIKSSFGEFSTFKESFRFSGRALDLGYYLSGSYLDSDGFRRLSSSHEKSLFFKAAHPLGDEARLIASYGYTGGDIQTGVTTSNRYNDEPYISRYGQLQLKGEKGEGDYFLAGKFNDQDITSDTYNATTGARVSSTVSNNLYKGISLGGSYRLGDDVLTYGSDFDWHTLKSTNYLDTAKDISMQAPYASYLATVGPWDITPALRYDHNEQFGSQLSPSLGAVYHLSEERETLVKAKYSRTFNAPPLLWIYNSDPTLLVGPNPDLEAERAHVYELGFETELIEGLDMDLNLYRMDVKNALATAFSKGLVIRENFRKFERQGAELAFEYDLRNHWLLSASGAFNDVENTATGQTVRDQGIARQSYHIGIHYHNPALLNADLYSRYNRYTASPSLQPNDRKFMIDLRLSRNLLNINQVETDVFLNVYNLANTKYWSSINQPHPPRYFEGGFAVRF